ncbi:putative ABC transport system permease protein [Lentzea albidocapillata subsp. violacea]|uniref:Putative ABC transport system permease protein n=1 Tax=Lentzea albidocapillata subsp. violacea TaxID=128104 RepID=A0A1G9NFK4_9PSEU|nr:ABC transporter permease [Lentzea albidocapillata]SDL85260.1 putative ABC transport system permease protein [Lentzea albidocapillata subsp. violacea]
MTELISAPPDGLPKLPRSARISGLDLVRAGLTGVFGRPARAILSAVGIAIGVAAMVAVLGISASSQAELQAKLESLGTNLLKVGPGQTLLGKPAQLPEDASAMVRRIKSVQEAASVATVKGRAVLRSDKADSLDTGGLSVEAVELELLKTLAGKVRSGAWLNAATSKYPTVVMGHLAAQRLAVTQPGEQVFLGGKWFTVIGILEPMPLAEELDRSAMVGWEAAKTYLGFDGHPTTVYERSLESTVAQVRDVLPATVNPKNPEEVSVTRPSDALAAQIQAKATFTTLFLGLGAVALLVGGVGVANTMVISVLERRSEIGLRRSLGAGRGQVRAQFLTEAVLLSGLGGVFGVLLGLAVSTGYAMSNDWPVALPLEAIAGGVGASVLIGTLAGWFPAGRAAKLSPTVALAAA